jgi:SAM-dependent methyltransferase
LTDIQAKKRPLVRRLKDRYNRELFLPTAIGILLNPFYIVRKGLASHIRARAQILSGDILDFGCGSKPYESLFQHAKSYVGCDVHISGHDHRGSRIDYYYDGSRLPFSDSQFDCVVSFETFEHVFNLPEILAEIFRVTKPGGVLLASVPFAWGEHEAPFDFGRYTSFGIKSIFERCGYRVEQLDKSTTFFLALVQLFIAYLYGHCSSRRWILLTMQIFLFFPITAIGLLANLILPKDDHYYCNVIVVARKF